MRRGRTLPLALALALASLGWTVLSAKDREARADAPAECRGDEVGIVIPAFSPRRLGDGVPQDDPRRVGDPLGQQVATVLNLQIWQTLRRSDGRGGNFGSGVVVWDAEPLAEPSFAAAEAEAAERECQLVYWGRAWTYGRDVVAQTYLSVLDRPVLWRADVELADGPRTFELGLPRVRYEFAPIVLEPEVVESFSRPSALKARDAAGKTFPLGSEFRAIEQHQGQDRAYVGFTDPNGVRREGVVQLPRLSRDRSEVVDFTGGVIRILRGDWSGARELLRVVSDDPATPAALAIDSLILQAVTAEKLGEDGWPLLQRAYERNPLSRITARYRLMLCLARLSEHRTEAASQALEQVLADSRYLFADDDPWIVGALLALSTR